MALIIKKRIPWRVRRRRRLMSDGFLPWELHRFRGVNKLRGLVDYPLSRPYVMRMRVARRTLFEEAKDKRLTMAEYRNEILRVYKTMGWMRTATRLGRMAEVPDVWAMFRYFYRQSVRLGDYIPPLKKKIKWSKGDVQTQRVRYKEKQEAKKRMGIATPSGDVKEWIRQLEARVKTEPDPNRKAQFEEQIKRLRGTV